MTNNPNGTDSALYSEEGAFIDLKSEIEDFLKNISEPPLQEFKNYMSIMFQSLKTSFDNVSMYQRQLNDTQDKLKRHIRNKNDLIKNIEEDNERYVNLKNETDNLYLKIDNTKHEESEKDKEIKILNEEIIKLNQRHDQENLSNFKPPELEVKMKLFQEKEDLENRISFLETKKNQQLIMLNNLMDENRNSEQVGKDYEEEYKILQKEIKEHQGLLDNERTSKDYSDKQFQNLRSENQNLKEYILKLQEEEKFCLEENDKLSKIHTEIYDDYNKKKTELNTLRVKVLPEMKSKLEEYERKLRECKKTIAANKSEISLKEKESDKYKQNCDKYRNMLNDNNKKIDGMDNEIDDLLRGKDNLKKDINKIDDEMDKQKANFMIVKNKLIKNNKLNDEMTRYLEKLTNEINEMHNQNIALENANHRAVNETYGIKRETQQLENNRDNIEKEKNLYAKQASDANMEHTQSLEKLKNLNEAIDELKSKNNIAETKLKQQKKIYEALKADCNRFEKKHQDAQKEIKEVVEEKTKKQQKYQFLKIELSYKQSVYNTTLTSLDEQNKILLSDTTNKKLLQEEINKIKKAIEIYKENNINLKKMIASAENDHQAQKKEYQVVLTERDFLDQQLIKRNDEIYTLYEKIKVLQSELVKMHQQYQKKIVEIEKLKNNRDFLLEEFVKTENIIKNVFELKVVKIKLEKELLVVKNKLRSLEDETKKPLNIHRWTKLEYSDPEKYELIMQINSLQRRLIAKTEEVTQKEELIQEKEKLYIKLKAIVARQSGTDMAEPLDKYKQKIKEETNRLKKLKEDIKNYRLTIRNYELEIKRIDNNVEKLRNKWYQNMKNSNYENMNNFDEIIEENQSNLENGEEDNENNNEEENIISENNNNNQEQIEAVEEYEESNHIDINDENREFFEFEKTKLNSA